MTSQSAKKLGVIIAVDGDIAQVGMYEMSNDSEYLWYGDVLSGVKVGAFVTINQDDVKIIASVVSEKIIDQQNTIKSKEFDNRYNPNSINRIVQLKAKGVISDGKFEVTSKFVPMIGNEVSVTTKAELGVIYGISKAIARIEIGNSLLEGQKIELPINQFFASHIGIFGNTGSGKSNTLHRLFIQLFRTEHKQGIIASGSQFYVIDFNGEYTSAGQFAIEAKHKKVYKLNTRNGGKGDKLPILQSYLFDADILAILFDARPATQVPFLRKAITYWNQLNSREDMVIVEAIVDSFIGMLIKILTTGKAAQQDAKKNWIELAKKYSGSRSEPGINKIENLNMYNTGNYRNEDMYGVTYNETFINFGTKISVKMYEFLELEAIKNDITSCLSGKKPIGLLKAHLEFQRLYVSSWGSTNIEHINPLFKRIEASFDALEKVVKVVDNIDSNYKTLNVISLVNTNQEVKRVIPMLLSKMIYDEQKRVVNGGKPQKTKHLIIDEAHNILNGSHHNVGDDWQDYRLSVFEEIIKEGRKFGFYLTLSSQRPADISPTILSQVHNYVIHRLVNDKDLQIANLRQGFVSDDSNAWKRGSNHYGKCAIRANVSENSKRDRASTRQ
ncbi:ATP-binding protein [Periweissella fabalis]|uniref:ATP-binding protein n=1 Tax=Periweissella fabalis TaxID=1070421 RepID=UPI0030B80650